MLHIVGLPHSDIRGSKLICSSPQLFAACHVLLRLPVPRHSPCALSSLNFMSFANLLFVQSVIYKLSFECLSTVLFCSFFTLTNSQPFLFSCLSIAHLLSSMLKNSICFLKSFVLFSFQGTSFAVSRFGWLKWARTTDLALIRRAL